MPEPKLQATNEHGEYKLKKRNVFLALLVAFFAGIFFACRTLHLSGAVHPAVHPLDLLSNDSHFYVKLPRAADSELVIRLLQSAIPSIDERSAKFIASRIHTLYAGISKNRRGSVLEASASGAIPKNTVQSMMKKLTDWKAVFVRPAPERAYDMYEDPGANIQLSVLSHAVACVAGNAEPMILKFDEHAFQGKTTHTLRDAIYDWLCNAENDIRFYAPNPISFLTVLTGTNLNLQLNYVKGSIVKANESEYDVSLEFDFNNEKVVRAGIALLSLAFGLTNSQVTQNSASNVSISNIRIGKETLMKIFSL